ncbi:MAG: cytochrome c [Gemmatimonadota bacterium]|jgi:cytochrome c oxidase cbb3-type subunit 3
MSVFVTREAAGGSDAEKNYRLYCVQYHGSRGNGRGINDTAGGLSVSPKNHVYAEEMSQLSDGELSMAIAEGGDAVQKSGLMPPWGGTLSAQEIDDLVLYLRQPCQCEAGG